MPDSTTQTLIGTVRCECGSDMATVSHRTTQRGTLYTVECGDCHDTGGYNSATGAVFGGVESLVIVGE